MARSRIVRPEFWSDEKMATISRDARLTYIGMWNLSDDYGVVKGNPMWLKNNIYPYEDISQEVFRGWLNELMRLKRIVPFEVNSEGFYLIRNFLKHQTINRPSQTRNPTPPDTLTTDSLNAHDILIDETEYKQSINRVKTETETEERARGKKAKPPVKKFQPPTQDEVVEYFESHGYSADAAIKAFQYYDAGQWKDSKGNPVRSWKQKMIAVWFKDENKDRPQSGSVFQNLTGRDRQNAAVMDEFLRRKEREAASGL